MLTYGYILGYPAGRGLCLRAGFRGLVALRAAAAPPARAGGQGGHPPPGEGEELEQLVRSFLWLRGLGLLRCPIIIADTGLSPAGWELALRLTARWPDVILWPAGGLEDCIARM